METHIKIKTHVQIITTREVFKYECNQLHDFLHIYATTYLLTLPILRTIVAGDDL